VKHLTKSSALLALTCAGTLWGLGFVFGKIAISEMPVGAMLAFRFTIATALLLPVLFIQRKHFTISKRDYRWIVLAGFLYVPVQFILQFEGLARTSVSHASLMVATVPAMLALVAAALTRRLPNGITAIAVVSAVAGAGIVAANASNDAHISGDLLVLVSLLAAVAWIMITDRRLGANDPVASTAIMLAVGTVVLVAFEALLHGHDLIAAYSLRAWLAVVACGVLSTAFSTIL